MRHTRRTPTSVYAKGTAAAAAKYYDCVTLLAPAIGGAEMSALNPHW